MPSLSKHEQSGAIGMLSCVFMTSRDIIIDIRRLDSPLEIVIRLQEMLNIDAEI